MNMITKYVGLDVHKDSIAVAEAGRSEPRFLKRIPNDMARLLRVLRALGDVSTILCAMSELGTLPESPMPSKREPRLVRIRKR